MESNNIFSKKLIYKSENLEWHQITCIDPKKQKEEEYINWWCDLLVRLVFGIIFFIFFGCGLIIFSVF